MDKLSATLLHCYLCSQSNTTCIPIPNKWLCHYCLSLGEGCIFIPPIPNHTAAVLLSRNCAECISSHRRCKFIDPVSNKCTRCTKMNVKCYFKFSERGRRNDLHPQIIFIQRPPRIVAMSRILYPNYWIEMGDLSMQTRVFTITILSMVRAATVVLNRSPILILEE